MEYLCDVYKDSPYRDYLDTTPLFSLAVIGCKELLFSNDSIWFKDFPRQFKVSYFDDFHFAYPSKHASIKTSRNVLEIFKSSWCFKHQQERPSCVLFCVDWDSLGDTALDELWLSSVFGHLKEHISYFENRIVLVLVSGNRATLSANAAAQFEQLQHAASLLFGDDFKHIIQLFENGKDKNSVNRLYQVAVELASAFHKSEMHRMKNMRVEQGFSAVRCSFKIGWHSLVLKDLKTARQNFEAAYGFLRGVSSLCPEVEVRVCGSLIVFHIIHAAVGDSVISYNDQYYRMCEDHAFWVDQPIISNSVENKSLARFLCLLLASETYSWLMKNVRDLPVVARNDLLTSAISSIEMALRLCTGPNKDAEEPMACPVFLGTECVLNPSPELHSTYMSVKILSERVLDLFSRIETQSKTVVASLFSFACASSCVSLGKESLALSKKLREVGGINTYKEVEAVYELLLNAKGCIDSKELDERFYEEIIFLLISLCFGPSEGNVQRQYIEPLLSVMNEEKVLDLQLSYPKKGYFSPFTVICGFATYYHDCSTPVELHVEFFTSSANTLLLDCLYVTLVRVTNDATEFCKKYEISKDSITLNVKASCSVCAIIQLEEAGFYECRSVMAHVKYCGMSLMVSIDLGHSQGQKSVVRELEILAEKPGVALHRPWVFVVKPVCQVDLEVPSSLIAMEGEDVLLDIVVKTQSDLAENGSLVLPYIPRLYEFVPDKNWEKRAKHGSGIQKGYRTVVLDNLPPVSQGSPLHIPIKYRCYRAGKYVAPIFFYFKSLSYSDREILKKIHVDVQYPFISHHAVSRMFSLVTMPFDTEVVAGNNGHLKTLDMAIAVPNASFAFSQRELCPLIPPRESANDDSVALHGKDIWLYGTFEKKDGIERVVAREEELLLVTTLKCCATQGITVFGVEVICVSGILLSSLSTGILPCDLEYMEVLTITAKVSVERVGSFSLGFVRLLFTPLGSAQQITSDISLPTVIAEDMPLVLSIKAPPSIALGSPFFLLLDVLNTTNVLQSCEMTVEDFENTFSLGGRTQWRFSVGPGSSKTTELLLHPLRAGIVSLPSVLVKHSSGTVPAVLSFCQSNSQKICVLPL